MLTIISIKIFIHSNFGRISLGNPPEVTYLHNSWLTSSSKREGAVWEVTWRINYDSTGLVVCIKKFVCIILSCLENDSLSLKTVETDHQIMRGKKLISKEGLW